MSTTNKNPVHFHCIWMEADMSDMGISKPGNIKPNVSAWPCPKKHLKPVRYRFIFVFLQDNVVFICMEVDQHIHKGVDSSQTAQFRGFVPTQLQM